MIHEDQIFVLSSHIAVESFSDGALLFMAENRQLLEFNLTADRILSYTDGHHSVQEIASIIANMYDIPLREALQDTMILYEELHRQKIVFPENPLNKKGIMTQVERNERYMRNPDVGLREEDEDGGLLFNPDTNQVKVLNPTGLFVWKHCDSHHGIESIILKLQEAFDDVPEKEVRADVLSFLEEMEKSGFLGKVLHE